MRKATIFNAVVFLLLLASLTLFTAAVALPKGVLVDRLLTEKGVDLIAREVREDLDGIDLRNVRIFLNSKELASFERLSLRIGFGGLELRGSCGSGHARLAVSWSGGGSFLAEKLGCVRGVEEVRGKLSLEEGIRGKLSLRGVSFRGVELSALDLTFEGKRFRGTLNYMGMELSGGGRIQLNRKDLLSSEVSARFSGDVGTLVVSGKLRSLRAQIQ